MPKNGDVAALGDLENDPEWHAARSPIFEATYKKLKYGRASPGGAARALHGCVKAHECVTVSMLRPLWAAEEAPCGAARAGGGAAMPFAGAAAGQARFNWPRARRTSWPKWPNFTVHGPRRRYLDNGRENGRGGCKRVITPRSGTIRGCMQRGMGSHLGERRLSFTPRLATAPCHSDLLCFEGCCLCEG